MKLQNMVDFVYYAEQTRKFNHEQGEEDDKVVS